jgi:hypothetical protein
MLVLEHHGSLKIMSRKRIRAENKKVARRAKTLETQGVLTNLQSRFAVALTTSRNKAIAARQAGYKGNPAAAGYQAFKAIQRKAPDLIEKMGISLENVIENYILPKMNATELKQFEVDDKEGNRRKIILELEAHMVNLSATRMLLELMNAFPTEDPAAAQRIDVTHIVVDIPRPVWPNANTYDVGPTNGNAPKKELVAEPDPFPKD